MEADTISVLMLQQQIDKMFMDSKAFVTSLAVEDYFHQIKGRKMIAYFTNSALEQVDVNGNGESVYFELEEEDSLVVGMNKVVCSDMRLKFKDNNITKITFYSPDGSFVPFHEIKSDDQKLEDFMWRVDERPSRYSVVGARGAGRPMPSTIRPTPSAKPVAPNTVKPAVKQLDKLDRVN